MGCLFSQPHAGGRAAPPGPRAGSSVALLEGAADDEADATSACDKRLRVALLSVHPLRRARAFAELADLLVEASPTRLARLADARVVKRLVRIHSCEATAALRAGTWPEDAACDICRVFAGAARAGSHEQVCEIVAHGVIATLALGLADTNARHALASLGALEAVLRRADRGSDCNFIGEFDAECEAVGVPQSLAELVRLEGLGVNELRLLLESSLAPRFVSFFGKRRSVELQRASCASRLARAEALVGAAQQPGAMPALVDEEGRDAALLSAAASRVLRELFPLFSGAARVRAPAEPMGDNEL